MALPYSLLGLPQKLVILSLLRTELLPPHTGLTLVSPPIKGHPPPSPPHPKEKKKEKERNETASWLLPTLGSRCFLPSFPFASHTCCLHTLTPLLLAFSNNSLQLPLHVENGPQVLTGISERAFC